jgi:UDP-N-acetylmuramoyl-tripeptide--D-alanyl-D-alanine ligase
MKSPLWTAKALNQALQPAHPCVSDPVAGVQIDSRQVSAGDLFFALPGDPGDRFTVTDRSDRDGHDYVAQALAAGAAGAVVSRLQHDLPADRQWLVPDTLDALWDLARARRAALTGPVVAVTGSSGKTTAKGYLAAATGWAATQGSLNNHLGVPLSLIRTPLDAAGGVYEVGMNHPGEIAPLSKLVEPELAVVLNVQNAHAEAFSDPDGIRQEKLSICQGLKAGGTLVVHDQVNLQGVPAEIRIVRFGESQTADVCLLESVGDQARYRVGAQMLNAYVPGGGRHRALTLAAVLATMQVLGLDLAPALQLSPELVPRGRGNRLLAAGVEIIDDSYNANPGSMLASLEALVAESATGTGRCFALLGEMLELGDASAEAHARLAQPLRALDGAWLVGDAMAPLAQAEANERSAGAPGGWWPVSVSPDPTLLSNLISTLKSGDKLLIKGSNRVFWQSGFVAELTRSLAESGSAGP